MMVQRSPGRGSTSCHPPMLRFSRTAATSSVKVRPPWRSPTMAPGGSVRASFCVRQHVIMLPVSSEYANADCPGVILHSAPATVVDVKTFIYHGSTYTRSQISHTAPGWCSHNCPDTSREALYRILVDFDPKSRAGWQEPSPALEAHRLAHDFGAERVLRAVALNELLLRGGAAGMPRTRGVEMQRGGLPHGRAPGVRRHVHLVQGSQRRNLHALTDAAGGAQIGL